jgi:site-specific DNA recombinase
MADQQETAVQLESTLRKQLVKLAVQEERLIDLAADGSLPQDRIRTRLNKILLDRQAIEERLARASDELATGASLLHSSLELCRDSQALYLRAPDDVRRLVNETYFEHFFIDDHGMIVEAVLRPPFDEFGPAVDAYRRQDRSKTNENAPSDAEGVLSVPVSVLPRLADVFLAGVSSKTILVGVTGFEPASSSSRTGDHSSLPYH